MSFNQPSDNMNATGTGEFNSFQPTGTQQQSQSRAPGAPTGFTADDKSQYNQGSNNQSSGFNDFSSHDQLRGPGDRTTSQVGSGNAFDNKKSNAAFGGNMDKPLGGAGDSFQYSDADVDPSAANTGAGSNTWTTSGNQSGFDDDAKAPFRNTDQTFRKQDLVNELSDIQASEAAGTSNNSTASGQQFDPESKEAYRGTDDTFRHKGFVDNLRREQGQDVDSTTGGGQLQTDTQWDNQGQNQQGSANFSSSRINQSTGFGPTDASRSQTDNLAATGNYDNNLDSNTNQTSDSSNFSSSRINQTTGFGPASGTRSQSKTGGTGSTLGSSESQSEDSQEQYDSGKGQAQSGGKPSIGDKVKGTMEKLAGTIKGDQALKEKGQATKTGGNVNY